MNLEKINYGKKFKEATGRDFDEYYGTFYNKLLYYITRFGINEIDADALVNDTFMRAFDKIEQYNNNYEFSTWIFTIARNLTLQHITNNKNTIQVDYNTEREDDFNSSTSTLKYHLMNKLDEFYNNDDEENNLTLKKYNETLKEIYKLGPIYKNIIILREIDGKTYDEIAEMLNISLQTVKNRIYHGRLKLNKILKPRFEQMYKEY